MLRNIPTHVIAGPLGAGKTTVIRHLMIQRPADERWAVLINEFGLVGIDAALLATAQDGIAIAEIAGGCVCCVNGAPFQIGLARLLRKARPDRLFIEPSGLGHPLQICQQLAQAPWRGVLAVQPLIMVVDAQALAAGQPMPASQIEAIGQAGLMIYNKSAGADRRVVDMSLSTTASLWTTDGAVDFSLLPSVNKGTDQVVDNLPKVLPALPEIWVDKSSPVVRVQTQPEGWAVGWRWHKSIQIDIHKLEGWLKPWPWRRAKMVIHSPQGWRSANLLANEHAVWKTSEWRRDSRLELIFDAAQDEVALQVSLEAALA